MAARVEVREHILDVIRSRAGFRLANVRNGTATPADRELLDEALGFRSLCLFSGLADDELKMLWDKSNLDYSL